MKRSTILLATMLLGLTAAVLPLATPTPAAADRPAAQPVARPVFGPDRPARVLLYGDSLTSESEGAFVAAVTRNGRAEVRSGVYGGTAICDWFDRMDADVAWQPDAVVIEFSGNALTPCMSAAVGDAYWETYRSDTEAVLARFAGVPVYLVGAPVSRTVAARQDPDADRLNQMYAAIAQAHPGVEYVAAQRAVLLQGAYTDILPCLPIEPCHGTASFPSVPVNVVRAPDGNHFCPEPTGPAVAGVTGGCPVWSSGAYRYGSAMAQSVVVDLDL